MEQKKLKRCQYVIISTEAKVLTELRLRTQGLSQRILGEKLGKSGSWVAQIESGRAEIPDSEMLRRYLEIVGPLEVKSFKERVRLYKEKVTTKIRLQESVDRLSEEQCIKALHIINAVLAKAIA